MSATEDLIISRDTFLQQLGLPHARQAVGGPQEIESLYDLVSDHLRAQGMAQPVAPEGTSHELALKLPGLPLHLRLTDLSREEIVLFVTAALVIAGSGGGLAGVASGVVSTLATRLKVLRAQYGELCLIEALAESRRPTPRNACATLLGKPCRRPKARCQFEQENGLCGFDLPSLQTTLQHLEAQKVVRRVNVVDPAEYGVVT
jgi:hypothetical protein